MNNHHVWFHNPAGTRLAGVWIRPDAPPPYPAVLFVHGLYSGKDSPRNRHIGSRMAGAGMAAFLFDITGHGESGGSLEEATLGHQVDDLGAALDTVGTDPAVDPARLGVIGSSSGGAVALVRAATDDRIRCIVLRSARVVDALDYAPRVRVPVLIIAGQHDPVVLEEARELDRRLPGPHHLEVIPGAGHLFEDPAGLETAAQLATEWCRQHLSRTPHPA